MRKLKLQMQVSVDGYVAGPKGEMDWMVWNWDDALKAHVLALTEPVDLMLLGRNLADGFIPAWAGMAAKPDADIYTKQMHERPKVVFSKTVTASKWDGVGVNVTVSNGDLVEEVNRLKASPGGDIIAYGGGTFVSELIRHRLLDELHLFTNPAAIGSGMSIFREDAKVPLKLLHSQSFDCGIIANTYALI